MVWLWNQTQKRKTTIEIWFNFFICSETGVCESETPYHANVAAAMTLLYLTTERAKNKTPTPTTAISYGEANTGSPSSLERRTNARNDKVILYMEDEQRRTT